MDTPDENALQQNGGAHQHPQQHQHARSAKPHAQSYGNEDLSKLALRHHNHKGRVSLVSGGGAHAGRLGTPTKIGRRSRSPATDLARTPLGQAMARREARLSRSPRSPSNATLRPAVSRAMQSGGDVRAGVSVAHTSPELQEMDAFLRASGFGAPQPKRSEQEDNSALAHSPFAFAVDDVSETTETVTSCTEGIVGGEAPATSSNALQRSPEARNANRANDVVGSVSPNYDPATDVDVSGVFFEPDASASLSPSPQRATPNTRRVFTNANLGREIAATGDIPSNQEV